MQKLRHLDGIGFLSLFYALAAFVLAGNLFIHWLSPLSILLGVSTLPFLFSAFSKGKGNVLVFLLAFFLGIGVFALPSPLPKESGTFQGFVIEAKANYFLFVSERERYYVYEKENTREFGDFLVIKGKTCPYECTEYESRFSFKDYLHKQGVDYQLAAYAIEMKSGLPLRFREKEVAFLAHFSEEGQDAIDALLFGHKDYSSDFIQGASAIGCLYFLSLSGALYGGVLRINERLLFLHFSERKSQTMTWFLALGLLPFGLYKIGIWRVFLGRSVRLVYAFRGKDPPPNFHILSCLGVLSVLVNRFVIFDSGFLLGYGLAFALALSQGILAGYPGKQKSVMTAAFVIFFLVPVLSSGGSFHLFSVLYSALFAPLVYPFAFLSFVSFLTLPFVGALNAYAHLLSQSVAFFNGVDLSIPLGSWGGTMTLAYYLFFGLFFYLRSVGALPEMKKLTALLIVSLLLQTVPIPHVANGQVSFINVGQGDAILIRSGFVSVMIDTGGNQGFDLAEEVDIPYLRQEQITHLDCLIASHSDYDHIGAGSLLSKHFRIDHFVDDASSFPLTVGPFRFENYNLWGGEDDNLKSLVLGLDFMGKKWLFTGDAPVAIETKIIQQFPELRCNVLKVGHHGSNTSSSLAFLAQLHPEVAIISVGTHNAYGHPAVTILQRLDALGIPYRRTDQEGTITYESWWGRDLGTLSR